MDTSQWIEILGFTLLHFIWQGILIAACYMLARAVIKQARTRYVAGMLAVLALLAAPLLTLARLARSVWISGDAVAGSLGAPVFARAGELTRGLNMDTVLPWLVLAWACGVVILATRTMAQWLWLQGAIRHAATPLNHWQPQVDRMCRRLGIRRAVRVLGSARMRVPALVGAFRPVILLPAAVLSGLSTQQLEMILVHELCHVRRWDYLANLLQVFVETVLFYHPAVYWVSRRVRQDRELCCDEQVLRHAGCSPAAYARALAEVARIDAGIASTPSMAPAVAATDGMLMERLYLLLGARGPQRRLPAGALAWAAVASLVLAAALWLPKVFPATGELTALRPLTLDYAVTFSLPRAVESFTPSLKARPIAMPALADDHRKPAVDVAAPAFAPEVAAPRVTPAPTSALVSPPRTQAKLTPTAVDPPAASVAPASATPAHPTPPANGLHAKVLDQVAPAYPVQALRRGREGQVTLDFSVAADGHARDIRVAHATHGSGFERAAREALLQWRFAAKGDAAHRYQQVFVFNLSDGVTEDCSQIGTHICH